MNRTKVGVIAGNYAQYRDFLNTEWPDHKDVFDFYYISSWQGLAGQRGPVLLKGTYWENPAYNYYTKEYKAFEYVNNQIKREWDS